MENDVFRDLKIVELASVLAGPAVGMFFAELGARVIKIENSTTGGDVTRGWKLPSEQTDAPVSAYFCSVNWGKEHLMLDFNDPADNARATAIIAGADVVISNFKPSAALRFGLDAATLRAKHPRLIYAQISAFADPEDESPAFDVVLQAEAGFLCMCGEADGPPVKMPVALIDLLAAHQLKEAILIALLQRERLGTGATVRTSLFESAIASLANQASNYLMSGHVPQRMGTRHPNIAPYGDSFECADGHTVLLAAGTERQFRQLCQVLGMPELLEHPSFRSNTDRVHHREALNRVLEKAIARFSLEELMAEFRKYGVPAGRIRDMASVFSLPAAQAMVLAEVEDGLPTARVRTVAFHIDESPETI